MKLVAGLGNPGQRYENNRHNIGASILKYWVQKKGQNFQLNSRWNAHYATLQEGKEKVIALLPLTYMNLSGDAVQAAMSFYKIPIENVLILHDEVDIPAGTFRIKRGGGDGGHNGLNSISVHGTDYVRVRLGIGRPSHPDASLHSFVLGDFSKEEKSNWENIYPHVEKSIELCIQGKITEAMNQFNRKDIQKD